MRRLQLLGAGDKNGETADPKAGDEKYGTATKAFHNRPRITLGRMPGKRVATDRGYCLKGRLLHEADAIVASRGIGGAARVNKGNGAAGTGDVLRDHQPIGGR